MRTVWFTFALCGLALGGFGPALVFAANPRTEAGGGGFSSASGETAELLRGWLAGSPTAAHDTAADTATDSVHDWRRYVEIGALPDAEQRERELRQLYRQTRSPLLRGVILRRISEDPAFRSRQALFIRHYGFYANWFNQLMFSLGGLLQGNLQSVLQLGVDVVRDVGHLFYPGEADPLDRRALDMMKRAQANPQGRSIDPRALRKLELEVDRTLAQADLESAHYALKVGDPEAAVFYANQAVTLRPDWTKASRFAVKAEAEAARQRLEALASSQVGYPDRQPPFESSPPELLRRLLTGPGIGAARPAAKDQLVTDVLRALPKPGEGRALMMRPWAQALVADRSASTAQRRWLKATLANPATNMDERLSQARSRRHGQLWSYIFIGPDPARDQLYKTASWVAQAWNALQNIGIFYGFEVIGRAGQSVFAPPTPADEVLDAEASWLRGNPDPRSRESQKVGRDLAKTYLRQKRFADARQALTTIGQLDARQAGKINLAEGRYLLQVAKVTPVGADRQAIIDHIARLAPDSRLARNAAKLAQPKKHKEPPQRLQLDWASLSQWTRQPPPCGLPGDPAWFDRNPANGEAAPKGIIFERKDDKAPITVNYSVDYPGETRVYASALDPKATPPAIKHWFDLATTQGVQAGEAIRQLNRLPVPFEVQGGAGPSGVDILPKLLPMQSRPGEIDLYK